MNKPDKQKTFFFCGIGGSGMAPLSAFISGKGGRVLGSDRAYDQGKTPEKFRGFEAANIRLFPQDGSGVTKAVDTLVVSGAVEETIPDVRQALAMGIPIRRRAEVLAELFNDSKCGVSVAGTSGKSTVTGMIATMLAEAGLDPTVMNGAPVRNFMEESCQGAAGMRIGAGDVFVAETDESDGSIALFKPAIAVLNNIALDHKPLEELEDLFGDFVARAAKAAVLNFDDAKVKALESRATVPVFSYAIEDKSAALVAENIRFLPGGVAFSVMERKTGLSVPVRLNVPGRHNVLNALACLSTGRALGLELEKAAGALETFKGVSRRLEVTGTSSGITVIDDFAHNPDKIAASLETLKEFDGRLIVIFQPHGFGPLKLMGREIAECFAGHLGPEDILCMPEVYYAGGTAERSVTSKDIVNTVSAKGRTAFWFEKRDEITPFILPRVQKGDRIIIMGARDDSLSDFARNILEQL